MTEVKYKNSNKTYLGIIPLAILVVTLIIVIGQNNGENSGRTSVKTTVAEILKVTDNSNQLTVSNDNGETEDALSIIPTRCRGCGKCTIIDSKHFQLSGQVAIVISQKNLTSNDLSNAIRSCHDGAIVLNI